MRAVVFEDFGGPEVVHVGDVAEPRAGAGEIRITVAAASINPIDLKQRSGAMAGGAAHEGVDVLGFDAAGIVDEVGSGVTGVSVGDAVLGIGADCQAEYAVLAAWTAKPAALSWPEAAALGVAGETAARTLALLEVDDATVLFVDGASGGVGRIAVQLAVARGALVIGSASAANQELVAGLGAEPVVYGDGVADRVREKAGGDAVDAVFDAAGRTPIEALVGLVGEPSQVVTIANFDVGDSGARLSSDRADADPFDSLRQVAAAFDAGRLRVDVAEVLAFSDARKAQDVAATTGGKVVLVPAL